MIDTAITDLARRIADELETAGVPYAIGGALAFAYWGPPRGTKDIDINVFVGPSGVPAIAHLMERAGVDIDISSAVKRAEEGSHVQGWSGPIPVDLFFNSIPLHESAATRSVIRPLTNRPVRILSAEDLVVLKLLFRRGKDIVDIEHLVGVQRNALDRRYIRQWLIDCVGEDDERLRVWDRISEALPPEKA